MKTSKSYRKNALRSTLQANMGQPVSEKEFARWFGYFCDFTHQSDAVRNAKTLSAELVTELAEWLGYPLI